MSQPSNADAHALNDAVAVGFGPCHCQIHMGRLVRPCEGHAWLLDDPTRRGLVKQWQRLLFMRHQRAALLAHEGVGAPSPEPKPVIDPTGVLPW